MKTQQNVTLCPMDWFNGKSTAETTTMRWCHQPFLPTQKSRLDMFDNFPYHTIQKQKPKKIHVQLVQYIECIDTESSHSFPILPAFFMVKSPFFMVKSPKKPSRCRPAPWPCGNRAPTAGRTRRWRAERRCLSHIFPRRHQRCGPEHGVYLQIYG